jgi:Transposase DDE domain group 1
LSALCERVDLLPGAQARAFVDIDSLLRPVYGHAKQGASFGHSKIAGKQVLRKGLSPLVTTISTDLAAPVIAGMRLRAGKTGSGKGAGRMVAQAIATARAAGITGQILVRGDSAYSSNSVVTACARAGAQFSLVLTKNPQFAPRSNRSARMHGSRSAIPARCSIPTPGHGSPMPRLPKPPTRLSLPAASG